MMGSTSIWHWVMVLIAVVGLATVVVPVAIILRRAGRSPWWAIVALVPWVNLVGLWIFALTRWPDQKR